MKLKSLLITLCVLSVVISSCKKDEDKDSDLSNYFTYSGNTYELGKGVVTDWGENEGLNTYDFDVLLFSSTIQYNATSDEYTGQGHIMYLDLNSTSANGLVNGTYTYSENRGAFTFVDGQIGINFNISTFAGTILDLSGGRVIIKVSGNVTSLEFDLTTGTNAKVTGKFSGQLTPREPSFSTAQKNQIPQ